MSDDKLLQKLTEAWQAMQEASLPQPGAVVKASGYPNNPYGTSPTQTDSPSYIAVISNYRPDALVTNAGGNLHAVPIRQLTPGGTLNLKGEVQIDKTQPIEIIQDIQSLNLTPEEMQKLDAAIKKFTGQSIHDPMQGVDVY